MKRWVRFAPALLAAAVLAAPVAAADAVVLSGEVVDAEGGAIAGCRVTLRGGSGEAASEAAAPSESATTNAATTDGAVTDAAGRFRLELAPSGSDFGGPVGLSFEAEGYAVGGLELPLRPAGPAFELGRVELVRGAAVAGRLVGPEGRRVAHARLVLAAGDFRLETRAAADGAFRFPPVAPGRYDLFAEARGLVPGGWPGLRVPPGVGTVPLGDLALERGVALVGRVVDAAGRPAAGVEVRVASTSGEPLFLRRSGGASRGRVARSGAAGRIRLGPFRAGETVYLMPGAGAVRFRPRAVEVAAGEAAHDLGDLVAERFGVVAGRVTGAGGAPLADARVRLQRLDEPGAAGLLVAGRDVAETGEDGTFRLEAPVAAALALRVTALGYAPAEIAPVAPAAAGAQRLEIALEPVAAGSLAVRVVDAEGAPAAGLEVRVDGTVHVAATAFAAQKAAADGEVVWSRLPVGRYTLTAGTSSMLLARETLVVAPGANRVELRLPPPPPLTGMRGRLLDEAGAPVRFATIRLDRRSGGGGAASALSDGRGEWRVELEPGTYSARVEHPAWLPLEIEALRVDAAGAEVPTWRMRRGALVRGRLFGLRSDELARLTISAAAADGVRYASGSAEFRGRFRAGPLGPGRWTIEARVAGGGRSARRELVVDAADDLEADLAFAAGHRVVGRVTDHGAPLAGARVSVTPADGRPLGVAARTGAGGEFELAELEAGAWDLRVSVPASGRIHRRRLAVPAAEALDIALATGRVAGRVVRRDDGAPLPSVGVSVRPVDHEVPDEHGVITVTSHDYRTGTVTDAQGRFAAGPLEAGRWRIGVDEEGFVPLELEVEVGGGRDALDLELEVVPTDGLTLEIDTELGSAPGSVHLRLLDAGCRTVARRMFPLEAPGPVVWRQAPPGRWTLSVQSQVTGARVELPVAVPGPPVRATLPSVGALHLTVAELQSGDARAHLRLLDAAGQAVTATGRGGDRVERWPLGDDRRFHVWTIPPGSYEARVEADDGRFWGRWLAIEADRATKVTLE